jgi:hypothetical protein
MRRLIVEFVVFDFEFDGSINHCSCNNASCTSGYKMAAPHGTWTPVRLPEVP